MVSKFILEKHLEYHKISNDKMTLNYNFINIEDYQYKEYHGNYFLFIGRLSSEKGLITLIKAFLLSPNCYLKIAGEGQLKDEMLIRF